MVAKLPRLTMYFVKVVWYITYTNMKINNGYILDHMSVDSSSTTTDTFIRSICG